MANGKFGRIRL